MTNEERSRKMLNEMMDRTERYTAEEGIPFVMVALKHDPRCVFVIIEAALSLVGHGCDVLHSGRQPLEV